MALIRLSWVRASACLMSEYGNVSPGPTPDSNQAGLKRPQNFNGLFDMGFGVELGVKKCGGSHTFFVDDIGDSSRQQPQGRWHPIGFTDAGVGIAHQGKGQIVLLSKFLVRIRRITCLMPITSAPLSLKSS